MGAQVRQAFESLRDRLARAGQLRALEGALVQPMVSGGVEVMVGVTTDPLFGPLIAFGLGGVHVEILGDVCFRITPLTDRDASEMVRSIRGYRLLEGYRVIRQQMCRRLRRCSYVFRSWSIRSRRLLNSTSTRFLLYLRARGVKLSMPVSASRVPGAALGFHQFRSRNGLIDAAFVTFPRMKW